jgi:predicted permease
MATAVPHVFEEVEPDPLLSRVVRGVVGGEFAGAVFALVTVWFTTSQGGEAKMPLLMMSTVASGSDSMAAGTASVATGVVVHLVLSALFGVLFALVLPKMRTNGTLLLSAGVYGLVVYLVNLRLLSPVFFPVFQDANQPFELLVHLIYGQLLALLFLSRGVRAGEPRFAWR